MTHLDNDPLVNLATVKVTKTCFISWIQRKQHIQKYFLHLIQTVFMIQNRGVWRGYKCLCESGQPDDPVLFPQAQRSRRRLLLVLRRLLLFNFPLRFFLRVPRLRVGLVLPCLATLPALRTLSVVWIHILLHTLSRVFQRGATDQAAVLHSWVQTQPVHHVVDTGLGGGVYSFTLS